MGEKNVCGVKEESLLQILSENYEALYWVDFDQNTIVPYRMSKAIEERFGDYFRSNPSYEDAMTGYINTVVDEVDRDAMLKRAKPDFIKEQLREKRTYSYDFRLTRDGKLYYYRFKISKSSREGEVHQAAVGFADVTAEMTRVNELMESKAMLGILEKDALTGLYTKEFFFKKVKQYMKENPDAELMFWTSDVQGLKVINEKYGMEKGDEILRIMAHGSKNFPGFLFGGRIEGDKFSALMIDTHPDYELINKQIAEGSAQEFPIPNVTIKHGVYHIRKNTSVTPQGMYDRSVLAMQSIKNKFGVCVALYDDKFRQDLLVQRQVIEDGRAALRDHQFQVYYQPKFDVAKGKTGGAEALVRWIHPEIGFMNPGVFIPLYEQNGFISKLDYYIWEEVCKNLMEWKMKGIPLVPVSVNVSRRDFEEENLADRIIEIVDRYGIEHSLFHVEVTESAYSDNPEKITNTIKKLHDSGFVIELDDFGTGYSSMIAISNLDLDIMKLDMSIIQNDVPGTDKNVLEFSMQLAKMMKLKTVAEGVETDEQADRIRSLGGNYIQGYFYSKPLPKNQFEDYIRNELRQMAN